MCFRSDPFRLIVVPEPGAKTQTGPRPLQCVPHLVRLGQDKLRVLLLLGWPAAETETLGCRHSLTSPSRSLARSNTAGMRSTCIKAVDIQGIILPLAIRRVCKLEPRLRLVGDAVQVRLRSSGRQRRGSAQPRCVRISPARCRRHTTSRHRYGARGSGPQQRDVAKRAHQRQGRQGGDAGTRTEGVTRHRV